jgi:hypothetical protein
VVTECGCLKTGSGGLRDEGDGFFVASGNLAAVVGIVGRGSDTLQSK